jgi:8-oxo-dGTP pyrophosphatase MutT (NUDIX family)
MRYLKTYKIFEHDYHGSMGAGIVPCCINTGRFLVALRSYECNEPGTYSGFGGKIELDDEETIEEAAIRESEEESQFTDYLKLIKGWVYIDGDFEYHNFLGLVEEEFEPILNWENDDAMWCTLEELEELKSKHYGLIDFMKNSANLFRRYSNS